MGGLWINESEFFKMYIYIDMKGFFFCLRYFYVLVSLFFVYKGIGE